MTLMLKQYVALQVWLVTRKKPSKGQSLAEYGLILALVAVFCIIALKTLGNSISNMMNNLANTIQSVPTSSG
jgi:pilus assembly protein Flp/PilA